MKFFISLALALSSLVTIAGPVNHYQCTVSRGVTTVANKEVVMVKDCSLNGSKLLNSKGLSQFFVNADSNVDSSNKIKKIGSCKINEKVKIPTHEADLQTLVNKTLIPVSFY